MTTKKNQNRREKLEKKCAVESLKFLTHYGLRRMGHEDGDLFHELADAEIDFIAELDLTGDILCLKNLAEGVRKDLNAEPTPDKGDLCASVVAIAVGIARIPELRRMKIPISWRDQVRKKILTIYYPEVSRNAVVVWAKTNGYNVSTYLGSPVVKFKQLFIEST